MIDLLTFDPALLPSLPIAKKQSLPSIPAIYLAIDSLGNIFYIGKSTNLRQRWVAHHRYQQLKDIEGLRLVWLEVSDISLLSEIEDALISFFKPVLNGKHTKICGSSTRNKVGQKITFTIEPDLVEPLKKRAKKERRSVGSLLNWLAAKYLEEQQGLEIEPTVQHGGDRKSEALKEDNTV